MEKKLPTVKGFVGRMLAFVAGGAVLGMACNITFYRLTLNATWHDQQTITRYSLPFSLGFVMVYLGVVVFLSRPLFVFLLNLRKGVESTTADLLRMQDTAIDMGWKLATLGFVFFSVTTPLTFATGVYMLGWPWVNIFYGLATGTVAGLLLFPYGMILTMYVIRPVIDYAAEVGGREARARAAGRQITLRTKITITFTALIGAFLIYTAAIGYSQTQDILANMKRIEELLPESERNKLTDEVEHKLDPRIRSGAFYDTRLRDIKYFYAGIIIVSALVSLILSWTMSGEISGPLRRLIDRARDIAAGRHGAEIQMVSNDELGELGVALTNMNDAILSGVGLLQETVKTLGQGVDKVDDTVKTILAISTEQSTGATQQASAVQQSSSIAEEIVVTARQIADKARAVDQVASQTVTASDEGEGKLTDVQRSFEDIAAQVEEIRTSMRSLQEQFADTYKIVQFMEEVAEQTELLALNAALEAAGAGEAGRRFSVVAEATRRLAVRSAQSASEIKALIETIQRATVDATLVAEGGKTKVDAGAADITEVAAALKHIKEFAATTSRSVREITLSTNQQSSASEQLAASIGEVREVAARVEEGAREIENSISDLRLFAESLKLEVEIKTRQLPSPEPETPENPANQT